MIQQMILIFLSSMCIFDVQKRCTIISPSVNRNVFKRNTHGRNVGEIKPTVIATNPYTCQGAGCTIKPAAITQPNNNINYASNTSTHDPETSNKNVVQRIQETRGPSTIFFAKKIVTIPMTNIKIHSIKRSMSSYTRNLLSTYNMNYNLKIKKVNITKISPIYIIEKRNMHCATGPIVHQGTKLLPHIFKPTTNMSTLAAKKYTKAAAKDLANDGKGNHTHVEKEICVKVDCENTQCQTLCDTLKETAPKGHNTHKPPIGRFCRFISETDANGNPQAQYFVPTNEKRKIPSSQVNSYGPQIKPKTKQQPYIDKYTNTYDQD